MKKTLLSVIAVLAVINVANAGIKETCLEHPDKLVWVEKTQRCVPINPCKSDDREIVNAYCDYFFEYSDMKDNIKREKLIKKYLGTDNIYASILESYADGYGFEQGWLAVHYNGYYKVFPYGNETESFGVFAPHISACRLYGGLGGCGPFDGEEKYTNCCDIKGISQCKELATFVSDLEGRNIKYQYDTKDTDEFGGYSKCILSIPFYGF